MPKRQPAPRRSRKKKAKDKAMTGPKSLYRGKVRRPLTLLLTPDAMKIEEDIQDTGVSRGDIYETALREHGPQIKKSIEARLEEAKTTFTPAS